jgi:phosphoglycerate kinase
MKILKDINIQNKRVLLRVDFNVPLDKDKKVKDTTRIEEALPTIKYLLEHEAKQIILIAHFGRPKGKVNEDMRLEPVAVKLQEMLGQAVSYSKDLTVPDGRVVLLENIRFYPGEEKNDPEFAKQLVQLADVYVNDAFGTAHRAHASTEGVAHLLPHAAGLLMQKEVENLTKVLTNPEHPVVAIIGGAKISTKIQLIKNLLPKVDSLLLAGALANTVLLAQNHKVGKSLVEADLTSTVKDLLDNKLRLPVDVITSLKAEAGSELHTRAVGEEMGDEMILDIGPDTIGMYNELISKAKTVIWNGPLGLFEVPDFAKGTLEIAKAVADSSTYSVIGGGETVEAVKGMGLADKISFISTGGGAMLEFLEGKELPGITALN